MAASYVVGNVFLREATGDGDDWMTVPGAPGRSVAYVRRSAAAGGAAAKLDAVELEAVEEALDPPRPPTDTSQPGHISIPDSLLLDERALWRAEMDLAVALTGAAAKPSGPTPRCTLSVTEFMGGLLAIAGYATRNFALADGELGVKSRMRLVREQLGRLFRCWYGLLSDASLGVPPGVLDASAPPLPGMRPWLRAAEHAGALAYLGSIHVSPPPFAVCRGFIWGPEPLRGPLTNYVVAEVLFGRALAARAPPLRLRAAAWASPSLRDPGVAAVDGLLRSLAYPNRTLTVGVPIPGLLDFESLLAVAPPCISLVLRRRTHQKDDTRTFVWPLVLAAAAAAGFDTNSEAVWGVLEPDPAHRAAPVRTYWASNGDDGVPRYINGCSACAHPRARSHCPFSCDIEDGPMRCADAMKLPMRVARHPLTRWRLAVAARHVPACPRWSRR